jgi:hypothetical protein
MTDQHVIMPYFCLTNTIYHLFMSQEYTLPEHLFSEIDVTVETAKELGLTEQEFASIQSLMGENPLIQS